MKTREYHFHFGPNGSETSLFLARNLPVLEDIRGFFDKDAVKVSGVLLVCDRNTAFLAEKIACGNTESVPLCVLPPGEGEKNWASVEKILAAAHAAGLGRDSLFVGIGGGVISDLTAFAASIYMRGVRLCLLSTTLLGMVDAALGGKTGFDLFGIKNLAGAFYPARLVYLSMESLDTLPNAEWKSGMAELIKTAILDEDRGFFEELVRLRDSFAAAQGESFAPLIARSVEIKGRIVEEDPKETGTRRILLNLGHSFGHALEAAAGLGKITHGEAVAWGITRAAALGRAFDITPKARAEEIVNLIRSYGYEIKAPHPLAPCAEDLLRIMASDKKKKAGKGVFVLPGKKSALPVPVAYDDPRLKLVLNGDRNCI